MKFKIDRSELLRGVATVRGAIDKRNTIPILSHVLIEAMREDVRFSATNQEVGLRCTAAATVERPGRACINAAKLYEIAMRLVDGMVEIELLSNNWCTISAGSALFKVTGLSPDEFPDMPKAPEGGLTISASELVRTIGVVRHAQASGSDRPNLEGVQLSLVDEKLLAVATDGHRLAKSATEAQGGLDEFGVITPTSGIDEVGKLALSRPVEEVLRLVVDRGVVHLVADGVELSSRLVEGEYPSFEQVIPRDQSIKVRADRRELLDTVQRVTAISVSRTSGCALHIKDDRLTVECSGTDIGEATDSLTVEHRGADLTIGVSARYLIEMLGAFPDGPIDLGFSDEVSPMTVRHDNMPDALGVIMLMRL